MAFSANILPQSKTFIPFHSSSFLNPKFIPKSSYLPNYLQTHNRISLSTSSIKVATNVSEVQDKSSQSTTSSWEEFARNVSGEWDGFGADFTNTGKPIELPEDVVPDAYREWEVKVFDWQMQCPTLAEPEKSSLMYKLIKLYPTVGCEADAATVFSLDERNIGGLDNNVSSFAYRSSGSYVAIWPEKKNGEFGLLELEHCLVDPRDRESRVKIIQVVRVDKSVLSLQNIKVFREQWYGPFRNGEQLGGCGIRDSGFASTNAMNGSEVTGEWKGSEFVTIFEGPQTNILQELTDEKSYNLVRDEQDLVLLPKQLWCSLKASEDGRMCGEVGWVLEQGRSITSKCIFSKDGMLQEIAIGHETKAAVEDI